MTQMPQNTPSKTTTETSSIWTKRPKPTKTVDTNYLTENGRLYFWKWDATRAERKILPEGLCCTAIGVAFDDEVRSIQGNCSLFDTLEKENVEIQIQFDEPACYDAEGKPANGHTDLWWCREMREPVYAQWVSGAGDAVVFIAQPRTPLQGTPKTGSQSWGISLDATNHIYIPKNLPCLIGLELCHSGSIPDPLNSGLKIICSDGTDLAQLEIASVTTPLSVSISDGCVMCTPCEICVDQLRWRFELKATFDDGFVWSLGVYDFFDGCIEVDSDYFDPLMPQSYKHSLMLSVK